VIKKIRGQEFASRIAFNSATFDIRRKVLYSSYQESRHKFEPMWHRGSRLCLREEIMKFVDPKNAARF